MAPHNAICQRRAALPVDLSNRHTHTRSRRYRRNFTLHNGGECARVCVCVYVGVYTTVYTVDLSARSKLNSPRNTGRPLAGESALTESAKTPLTRAYRVQRTGVYVCLCVDGCAFCVRLCARVYIRYLQIRGID